MEQYIPYTLLCDLFSRNVETNLRIRVCKPAFVIRRFNEVERSDYDIVLSIKCKSYCPDVIQDIAMKP